MDKKYKELEKAFGQNRIKINEPISLHTTFKIGGPAEYYIDVEKIEDLIKAINLAKKLNLKFFVLGGGSNIIVSDEGVKGLVIKNNCRRFELMGLSGKIKDQKLNMDKAMLYAESGVIMNQLVRFTIDQGLAGLEYHLGLPGTVGGAVFMNSNFPEKDVYVGDCIFQIRLLTQDGVIKDVDRSYFNFSYDQSILQKTKEIVLYVMFKMLPGDKKMLWEKGTRSLEYRRKTQPKGKSAGCTFRNISITQALSIPTPGRITSAGYLIDKAGLKGKRIGDAMVSDIHANYILNLKDATSKDVMGLIKLIQNEVFKKFKVKLVLEIQPVGFENQVT